MRDTLYRLVDIAPTAGRRSVRMYVSDLIGADEPDPYYVWTHDVRKATLLGREEALRLADVIDAQRRAYIANHPEARYRGQHLPPLAIVPRTGGAWVDRGSAARKADAALLEGARQAGAARAARHSDADAKARAKAAGEPRAIVSSGAWCTICDRPVGGSLDAWAAHVAADEHFDAIDRMPLDAAGGR